MPLDVGTRLGAFEVLSLLGAGGMGEVYRARDHKLNRDVALKVLGAQISEDEGLRRFLREAQSLAALNHPHIAQIYGLEDSTSTRALVMELVEGEDLARRISRGPIALDEASAIARQIADALEAAHDVGIVHRDLKPANVKVRSDGTVKILDFGIAKVLNPAAESREPSQSPTFTSPAMTSMGVILGTASYMSPEQARGKSVDKRADIWAFGVVLFEMLTGRVAFVGETVTDVLAAVVSRDPDWSALPGTVPPRMTQLLRRCLDKDPRTRLRDIGEARIALDSTSPDPASAPKPAAARRSLAARGLPWAIAAVAAAMATASWLMRPAALPPLRKLELALPTDTVGSELSPNGERLALRSPTAVVVKDLIRGESRDVALSPAGPRTIVFWAHDGQFVAYNDTEGRLWSVPIGGGTPRLVCTIPETRQLMSGAWLKDGSIVFSVWRGSLYRVSAFGGQPVPLLTIDPKKEVDIHQLVELPDDRLLLTVHLESTPSDPSPYRLDVLGPGGRQVAFGRGLLPFAYTASRHLLLLRTDANQGVWAIPYKHTLPLRLEDGFLVAPDAATPSASKEGALLYVVNASVSQIRELVWMDRSGQIVGQLGTPQPDLINPALSPDDQQVAFGSGSGNTDIWVRDLRNDIQSRVTTESDEDGLPSWFPNGRRLIYSKAGGMLNQFAARNADGSGGRQDLGTGSAAIVSPDGRYVAYTVDERGAGSLRYSAIGADGTLGPPQKLFSGTSEPNVLFMTFSPDSKLLAYTERQSSGMLELFVTRFPSGEGRSQVSASGGQAPVWAHTGELFFADGAVRGPKQMMVTTVKGGESLAVSSSIKLFDIPDDFLVGSSSIPSYDVARDGKRLLMVRSRRAAGQSPVRWVLVQNWLSEFEP